MNFLVIYICLFSIYVLAEDIKDLNTLELIKLGQDVSQVINPYEPQPTDVQFYLVSSLNSEPVLIDSENKELVNFTLETKIVIHGWLENHKRSWYQAIAEEYLQDRKLNFIEVDWERPARIAYVFSAKSTKMVGIQVAQFIEDMGLSPKDVHLIGHSLGSHIAGFAGKKVFEDTGEKLGRITGLDPAGPYFRIPSVTPSERLSRDDAEIVDVLHTDAGFYGYENPIGTLDIYINGGQRIQPGCLEEWSSPTSFGDILEKSFCSHARSTRYFTEWIKKGKLTCRFCQPVLGINLYGDRCTFHHIDQVLGADDVTADVQGVCFASTKPEEPFLD